MREWKKWFWTKVKGERKEKGDCNFHLQTNVNNVCQGCVVVTFVDFECKSNLVEWKYYTGIYWYKRKFTDDKNFRALRNLPYKSLCSSMKIQRKNTHPSFFWKYAANQFADLFSHGQFLSSYT